MPGKSEGFKLDKYKEDLCKPYSQILFYLCTSQEFNCESHETDTVTSNLTTDRKHDSNFPNLYFNEFEDNIESCLGLFDDNDVTTSFVPISSVTRVDNSNIISTNSGSIHNPNSADDATAYPGTSNNANFDMQPGILSLSDKLKNISTSLYSVGTVKLSIRRRKIWLDTAEKLKRAFKNGVKLFSVHFIGEEAVDAGGPLKEFFSVLFDDIKNYLLVSGNNSGFTFLHDLKKLKDGDYKLFGSLVALALLSGCAGPRYFMPCVVSKILDGPSLIFNINDVPDIDIQSKLNVIITSMDEVSFKSAIDLFPERFDFGVTQLEVSFKEKEEFLNTIIRHCCLSNCSEEMQEFIDGMDFLGLVSILRFHCKEISSEFAVYTCQKASDVLEIYTTVAHDNMEDKTLREAEEDIYYNWTNFLESLETDGERKLTVTHVDEDGNETQKERKILLSDVIRFLTGSKFALPSMLGKGKISFQHVVEGNFGKRVEVNTCVLCLTFPVTPRYKDHFFDSFCDDICSAPDFGKV